MSTSPGGLSPTASGTPGGTARRQYVRTSEYRDSVRTPIGKEFSLAEENSQDPLMASSNSRGMDNGGTSATALVPAAKTSSKGKQYACGTNPSLPPNHFLASHNLAQHKLHSLGREKDLAHRLHSLRRNESLMYFCKDRTRPPPPSIILQGDDQDSTIGPDDLDFSIASSESQNGDGTHQLDTYLVSCFTRAVMEETRVVSAPDHVQPPNCDCDLPCTYRQQFDPNLPLEGDNLTGTCMWLCSHGTCRFSWVIQYNDDQDCDYDGDDFIDEFPPPSDNNEPSEFMQWAAVIANPNVTHHI